MCVDNGKYQTLEHFYQKINGFMNEKNTVMLDHVIGEFPPGGVWVELGSWTGRSAAYCVVELINHDRLGSFYCVDKWQGEPGIDYDPGIVSNMRRIFKQNLQPVIQHITMLTMLSWNAARRFDDATVDFCYVDAGHSYECVSKDLAAWWPKMRPGAYFAGDDYTKGYPGLQQAVWDFFKPKDIKVARMGRCWIVRKPEEPNVLD